MAGVVYRIRNWDELFENNRTRDLKQLTFVCVPNKHDGEGYLTLVDHPDGTAHYGAWHGILQVASKCRPRGTLVRDSGRPHTAKSIARKTRLDGGVISAALERLTDEEIGWVEVLDAETLTPIPQDGAGIPQHGALKGREGKGREGKEDCSERSKTNGSEPPNSDGKPTDAFLTFPCSGRGAPSWILTHTKVAEYRESFPGVDVEAECRKALQWCRDNKLKRKTARGMPAFLGRWLGKTQDRGGKGLQLDAPARELPNL